MQLGPYTLPNPWILAPMAGVSERPFRRLAREMGAAATPTELVSCKGLMQGQGRSEKYLDHDAAEDPFWVQLFGGEIESMAAGAERAVELGAKIIDINMGCPVRKVTKNGAGSALLREPARAAALVEAMGKRTGVPITVKIRSGWSEESITMVEVTRAVADAGAVAIAMHARTREQGYSGTANWVQIRELVEASPIPVIGNGDAFTPTLARRMLDETGCAAVMIGRGAMGNPWIFEQLAREAEEPTPAGRWTVVRRHLLDHIEHIGDELRGIRNFRPHLAWYSHGLSHASRFRARVMTVTDLAELLELGEGFFAGALRAKGAVRAPIETKQALG